MLRDKMATQGEERIRAIGEKYRRIERAELADALLSERADAERLERYRAIARKNFEAEEE